jgi:hypothetical protein
MEAYKIYHVSTAKIKPGKANEAVRWWQEKGKATYESSPGVKSAKAYGVQFSLGGDYGLEIWLEIENYAAYDRLDEDLEANPQKYAAFGEARDFFEWGPARVMGDWPQSSWSSPEEEPE